MNIPNISKLAEGVRLCSVKTSQFKTGKIIITMALPLDNNACANAVLPYILHRSCAAYPDFSALNGKLAELYGAVLSASVSKHGEAQLLTISLTAIDDRFSLTDDSIAESCAELLTELIFEPKLVDGDFLQDDVEREKRLLLERMESENDDKGVYAFHRCEEIMCKDEAFGIPKFGTAQGIKSLTTKDVFNAWQRMIKTATVQITVISSGDSKSIEESFKQRFSQFERNPVKPKTLFVKTASTPQRINEEQPVKQGKLVMGFRAGMENAKDKRYELSVAVDLFGGGTYSKLFSNVREKMSLCYYCQASLQKQKGIIFVKSGIETENEEKAANEILRQLDLIKRGEVSLDEFNASILSLCDRMNGYNDSPETVAAWYFSQIFDDEIITPEQCCEKYKKVTLDSVIESAKGITLDTVFMLSAMPNAQEE